jgi:choline dehydrogenase
MGKRRCYKLVFQVSNFYLSNSIIFRYCLPYFKKSQCHELSTGPDDPFRGHNGPLKIMQGKCEHPLHKAFIEAGIQQGVGTTTDMNGYKQEGCGPMDMAIHKGVRQSASRAYLHPVNN